MRGIEWRREGKGASPFVEVKEGMCTSSSVLGSEGKLTLLPTTEVKKEAVLNLHCESS